MPLPDSNGHMSRLLTLLRRYHFDYAVGRRNVSLEYTFRGHPERLLQGVRAARRVGIRGTTIKPWLDYFFRD